MGGSESKAKESKASEVAESQDPATDWIAGLVPAEHLVSDADAWARNLVALSPARRRVAIGLISLFSTPKDDVRGLPLRITSDRLRLLAHWVGDDCYGKAATDATAYPTRCYLRTRFLQALWQFRSFQPFEGSSSKSIGDIGRWSEFDNLLITLHTYGQVIHDGSWELIVFSGERGEHEDDGFLRETGEIYASSTISMPENSRRQFYKMQAAVVAAFADEREIMRLDAKEESDWKGRGAQHSELNSRLEHISAKEGFVDPCPAGRVSVRGVLGSSDVTVPKCEAPDWMISDPIPQWAIDAADGELAESGHWSEPHDAETAQDISGGDVNVAVALLRKHEVVARENPAWLRRQQARQIAWLVRWLGSSLGPRYGARLADLRARWSDPAFEPFYLLRKTTTTALRDPRDILDTTYPGTYLLGVMGGRVAPNYAQVR